MEVSSLKNQKKKNGMSAQYRWALTVFLMAVALSAVLSLASESMLERAKPFHAMAAHKEKGAKESLMLLRNAGRVSSVCNDVVGDICGIVSGATGAVIVTQLQQALNLRTVLISVGVTALVSGLTIGGKALGKTFAIQKSTKVVYWAGRVLHIFHR